MNGRGNFTPTSGHDEVFRLATALRQARGFPLIELLVVLVVLALWAMLLAPALSHTQPDSRAFQCLNNHRQLGRAWLMFANDNSDRLVMSYHGGIIATDPSAAPWATGWLD